GIGIPADKRKIIFEAFQQADMTTSRKYGGTGLGLTISREIAKLLGGEIHVGGEAGKGSTFTLYLPKGYVPTQQPVARAVAALEETAAVARAASAEEAGPKVELVSAPQAIEDDRHAIAQGDKVLLIVDDDPTFGRILVDMARESGFRAVVAQTGEAAVAL